MTVVGQPDTDVLVKGKDGNPNWDSIELQVSVQTDTNDEGKFQRLVHALQGSLYTKKTARYAYKYRTNAAPAMVAGSQLSKIMDSGFTGSALGLLVGEKILESER